MRLAARKRTLLLLALLLALVAGAFACSACFRSDSPLTETNSQKIDKDMPIDDVVKILGQPQLRNDDESLYNWYDDDARITVAVKNRRVAWHSFRKEKTSCFRRMIRKLRLE